MNKCKNCQYWKRQGITLLGTCALVANNADIDMIQQRIFIVKANGFAIYNEAKVYVGESFGCVNHKEIH